MPVPEGNEHITSLRISADPGPSLHLAAPQQKTTSPSVTRRLHKVLDTSLQKSGRDLLCTLLVDDNATD